MTMAHEGEPNMGFVWRDGIIEIDTARQGRALGNHTAFILPFTDSLTPYRMGDSGFTGSGFDQGGIVSYQTESTLLKWSAEQSQWLQEGFSEQVKINSYLPKLSMLIFSNNHNKVIILQQLLN